jgi:hypothetical protein
MEYIYLIKMFRDQTIIDRIFKQEIIYNIPLFEVMLLVFVGYSVLYMILDIIEAIIIKWRKNEKI